MQTAASFSYFTMACCMPSYSVHSSARGGRPRRRGCFFVAFTRRGATVDLHWAFWRHDEHRGLKFSLPSWTPHARVGTLAVVYLWSSWVPTILRFSSFSRRAAVSQQRATTAVAAD